MSNKLKNQDFLIGAKNIKSESVDVIITSPPYNIGKKYDKYEDDLNLDDYLAWSAKWVGECKRVLKPDGSIFINFGSGCKTYYIPFLFVEEVWNLGLKMQNVIHWIKSITVNGKTTGHFTPINSKKYLNNCHEYLFHFTKELVDIDRLAIGVDYEDKSNIKRFSGNKTRCRGNTWFLPYKTRNKKLEHPASFPVDIPENCLKLCNADEKTVVLDPFMGGGTTGIAAKKFGSKFIGFDISKKYFDLAKENLK